MTRSKNGRVFLWGFEKLAFCTTHPRKTYRKNGFWSIHTMKNVAICRKQIATFSFIKLCCKTAKECVVRKHAVGFGKKHVDHGDLCAFFIGIYLYVCRMFYV